MTKNCISHINELEKISSKLNDLNLLVNELGRISTNDRFQRILDKTNEIKRLDNSAKEIEKILCGSEDATKKLEILIKQFDKLRMDIDTNIDPLTINLVASADKIAKNVD